MRRQRGFTLIELMVVLIIIAVLMAIAIPAYRDSVRKSRRAVAQTCLTEFAQYMERFYTTHLQYHQTRAATPVAVTPPGACTQDVTAFYTLAFDTAAPPTATTYKLVATPIGDQADDKCGTLKLSNTGQKEQAAGATAAECWR